MKLYAIALILCLITLVTQAQEESESGHYLVEFEKFTPPVKDMIRSFEGLPATTFMANDMNGTEQFLGDFQGKTCLIFFWNTHNAEAVSLIYDLNKLQKKYKDLVVIGLADESREKISDFLKEHPAQFIVIPNSRMLSEAVYGVELGYPRMFIVDESGIIRCVIPGSYFAENTNAIDLVESAIRTFIQ